MTQIRIIAGSYRGNNVVNTDFIMVKPYAEGVKGGYVTVRNDGQFNIDIDKVRVLVSGPEQIQYLNAADAPVLSPVAEAVQVEAAPQESDEEAMDRIAGRFSILHQMTRAAIAGDVRALIVSGPPGVGKSHGIEQELEKASMFTTLSEDNRKFDIIKGTATAIGLYQLLYKHSDAGSVLVLDDCDTVLGDDQALNILKGALDSGRRRRISWNAESRVLRENGVPDSFNFNGAVIFVSNLKFDQVKSSKIKEHTEALMSRCHYLDLTINTMRDRMLRIRQVHRDAELTGGLFSDYDFSGDEDLQILDFMEQNQTKLRELSLRVAMKLADLIKVSPANWKALAKDTCMKA